MSTQTKHPTARSGFLYSLLATRYSLLLAVAAAANAQQPRNVQASIAVATRDEITADLKFGTGRTQSFLAGSTLSLAGTLSGTPTGGTLSLANVTLTLPSTVTGGTGSFQPLAADLTAIAALTTTAFGRGLLTETNAGTARTTLGVAINSDVQAYDADLAAIAALTTTAFGRGLLTETNAGTARTTLGVAINSDVQAYDADLAALAGLTSAADKLPYFTGSGTATVTTFTSYARTLVDDADAATARATLGLVAVASSGSASDLTTGTLATARGGLGADNSAATGVPIFASGTVTITGTTGTSTVVRSDTPTLVAPVLGAASATSLSTGTINNSNSMTIGPNSGASKTLTLQTTTSGGTATNAFVLGATQDAQLGGTTYGFLTNSNSNRLLLRADSGAGLAINGSGRFATTGSNFTIGSGQLFIEDGNAGAPGVAFTNDGDCGMYRIGTNSIGLAAGGVVGLTIDSSLKISIGTTSAVSGFRTSVATRDFPSVAAIGGTQDLTITVTGAAVGNPVMLALPAAPDAGIAWDAWVSAADTVTIRATNATATPIDPASASFRVTVISH